MSPVRIRISSTPDTAVQQHQKELSSPKWVLDYPRQSVYAKVYNRAKKLWELNFQCHCSLLLLEKRSCKAHPSCLRLTWMRNMHLIHPFPKQVPIHDPQHERAQEKYIQHHTSKVRL